MKKYFILFLLLSGCTVLNAQIIEGKVFSEKTNEPLEGAHVYTKDQKSFAVTNKKGVFKLKIWSNKTVKDTIIFSYLGYNTKTKLLSKDSRTIYKVYLSKEFNTLTEVNIYGERDLNNFLKFENLEPIPKALYSFGSALVENKIYVIGGDISFQVNGLEKEKAKNPVEVSLYALLMKAKPDYSYEKYQSDLNIYNLESNSWETSTLDFKKRAYHKANYSSVNKTVYVLGGKNLSINNRTEFLDDQIELYHIENDTILIDNTNPHQAVNFESLVYQNNLVVFGGSTKKFRNGRINYSDEMHLFNMDTGYWYKLGKMLSAKETKGVIVNNEIFIFGGFNSNPLSDIESYDLITGKWNVLGTLFSRLYSPAITSNKNMIYIFEDQKLLTYNVNTKELREYLIDISVNASSLNFYNEKLYIIGGYVKNEFSIKPSNNVYSVDLNEFDNTVINKVKTL